MPDLFLDENDSQNSQLTATIDDEFLNPSLKVRDLNGQIDWITTQRKVEYVGKIKTIKERLKFTHNGGTQWHFDAQREIQDGVKAD